MWIGILKSAMRPVKLRSGVVAFLAQHEGVIGVQPGHRNVDPLPAVRQVGHERPKVHQPSPERLVGTGSGFNPLQRHAGAPGRFVDSLYRNPGGTAVRPHLDGRNVLKADAQSASRDGGVRIRKVPRAQSRPPARPKQGWGQLASDHLKSRANSLLLTTDTRQPALPIRIRTN